MHILWLRERQNSHRANNGSNTQPPLIIRLFSNWPHSLIDIYVGWSKVQPSRAPPLINRCARIRIWMAASAEDRQCYRSEHPVFNNPQLGVQPKRGSSLPLAASRLKHYGLCMSVGKSSPT
jgi:hypothetical protein